MVRTSVFLTESLGSNPCEIIEHMGEWLKPSLSRDKTIYTEGVPVAMYRMPRYRRFKSFYVQLMRVGVMVTHWTLIPVSEVRALHSQYCLVAQLVELWTVNPSVEGSSPSQAFNQDSNVRTNRSSMS